MTPHCTMCGVALDPARNWPASRVRQNRRCCRSCQNKTSAAYRRRAKGGRSGIYIIVSSAHPGWCKVGISKDVKNRLRTYNTGCPHNSFSIYAVFDEEDKQRRRRIEEKLLRSLRSDSEWVERDPLAVALYLARTIRHERKDSSP